MADYSSLARRLKSPMSYFFVAFSFLVSGFLINIGQLLLYVCLRPLNKRLFHLLNYFPVYWVQSQLVAMTEWWGGVTFVCYTEKGTLDNYLGKEHACCIYNHTYEMDWLVVGSFCDKFGMVGNIKYFSKKSIQYVPVLGWTMKLGGDIFLERNWDKDKDIIERQMKEFVDSPYNMWLALTPEGTRFTQAKHEASQKFAREKGLPELRHHLTPRTKGFTHTMLFLRGKVDAIYDMQLAFTRNVQPTSTGLTRGEKYEAHIYINRIPLSTLPEGEEELAKWMHQLFQKKDRMMDSFVNTGDFFRESGVPAVPAHRLERRWTSLLTSLVSGVVVTVPAFYYLLAQLPLSVVLTTIALSATGLVKLIGTTKASQGSSYGIDRTSQRKSMAQNKS